MTQTTLIGEQDDGRRWKEPIMGRAVITGMTLVQDELTLFLLTDKQVRTYVRFEGMQNVLDVEGLEASLVNRTVFFAAGHKQVDRDDLTRLRFAYVHILDGFLTGTVFVQGRNPHFWQEPAFRKLLGGNT